VFWLIFCTMYVLDKHVGMTNVKFRYSVFTGFLQIPQRPVLEHTQPNKVCHSKAAGKLLFYVLSFLCYLALNLPLCPNVHTASGSQLTLLPSRYRIQNCRSVRRISVHGLILVSEWVEFYQQKIPRIFDSVLRHNYNLSFKYAQRVVSVLTCCMVDFKHEILNCT
jgi:hypothetical protein